MAVLKNSYINITTPRKSEIHHLKVPFMFTQEGSGDPSPSNERSITGLTGLNVYKVGKNFIDTANNVSYGKLQSKTGELEDDESFNTTDYFYLPPGEYILSVRNTSTEEGSVYIRLIRYTLAKEYYARLISIQRSFGSSQNWRIHTTTPCYIRLSYHISDTDIQLERGNILFDCIKYEPHKHSNIVSDWTSTAGTLYGGYVDLVTGQLVQTHNYATIDENSTISSFTEAGDLNRIRINMSDISNLEASAPKSVNKITALNYCFSYNYEDYVGYHQAWETYIGYASGQKVFTLWFSASEISTEQELLSYLAEHPLHFVYELETPITYSLAPQQIETFAGDNHLFTGTDAEIEIDFDLYSDTAMEETRKKIMMNQPHITSAAGNPISFNTDVPAYLKECKVSISPVQDLHGYSNPWPAGGGKNLVNASPITINEAGDACSVVLPAGDYVFSATITNDSGVAGKLGICYGATSTFLNPYTSTLSGRKKVTFTLTAETQVRLRVDGDTGLVVSVSDIMVEHGSDMSTYEPYENICPITGYTGLTATKCGKNIVDITRTDGESGSYNSSGEFSSSLTYQCLKFSANPGDKFTKSGTGGWGNTNTFWKNGVFVSGSGGSTLTVPDGANEFKVQRIIANNKNWQLEFGQTATDYEEYNGVTIPITFPVMGKNLFNAEIEQGSIVGQTGENNASTERLRTVDYIKLSSGQYTISAVGAEKAFVFVYSENGTYLENEGSTFSNLPKTFSITGNKLVRFSFRSSSGGTFVPSDISNIQLETGSSATAYKPYTNTVYGGELDLLTGVLTVNKQYFSLNGTETFTVYNSNQTNIIFATDYATPYGIAKNQNNELSSHYRYHNGTTTLSSGLANMFILGSGSGNLFIQVSIDEYPTITDYQTYLAAQYANGTPVQFCYNIADRTYQLTAAQIKTLLNKNNIWTNSGTVSVKYWTH